jgi:hypothetical protein
MSMG